MKHCWKNVEFLKRDGTMSGLASWSTSPGEADETSVECEGKGFLLRAKQGHPILMLHDVFGAAQVPMVGLVLSKCH